MLMHYMNYYYCYVRQGMIFRSIQLGKLIFRLNTKRIVLVLLALSNTKLLRCGRSNHQ